MYKRAGCGVAKDRPWRFYGWDGWIQLTRLSVQIEELGNDRTDLSQDRAPDIAYGFV
jgi:hypothetical protein